jgi:hypothetical protein
MGDICGALNVPVLGAAHHVTFADTATRVLCGYSVAHDTAGVQTAAGSHF